MSKKYSKLVLPPDNSIIQAVATSTSMAQVLRTLGVPMSGNNLTHTKRAIERLKLGTSHFTGQLWSKGKTTLEDARIHSKYTVFLTGEKRGYVDPEALRKALAGLGVEEKCSGCGVVDWLGQPLRIEVDHIDGDAYNNVPSNLRYLCPNCHSQTPTSKGRNIKKGQPYVTDEEILEAVQGASNARQALIKLRLSPKGGNYFRIYDVMGKHGVVFSPTK